MLIKSQNFSIRKWDCLNRNRIRVKREIHLKKLSILQMCKRKKTFQLDKYIISTGRGETPKSGFMIFSIFL